MNDTIRTRNAASKQASKQKLADFTRESSRCFKPFYPLPLRRIALFSATLLGAAACLSLAGCSAIPNNPFAASAGLSEIKEKATIHGAKSVIPKNYQASLVNLLAGEEYKTCPIENKGNAAEAYQCGIEKFYARVIGKSEANKRMERNRVQESILSVAEDRCTAYKQYLRYDQAESNFWMGSTATVMGALGAIVNTATAARTYSAAAGVLAGVNAEYNQAYFGNLFYNVITKAIDEDRREAYREIQEYGQKKDLASYPVEAAIKDAIVYDGKCSAVSALEYAEQSVRLVNDPGLDSLNRVLVKLNQAKAIIEKKTVDLGELSHDREGNLVSTLENIRFGSRLGSSAGAPFDFIQSRLNHANTRIADLAAVIADVRHSLSSEDTAKLDKTKDAWEKSIKDAFDATFKSDGGTYPAYQANIQACTTTVQASSAPLETARAKMTVALADKEQPAIDKARHDISQAQGEIDKLTESVGFVTRHLDNLIDQFIEVSAKVIHEAKEKDPALTISPDFSKSGQFDTACGKLK